MRIARTELTNSLKQKNHSHRQILIGYEVNEA